MSDPQGAEHGSQALGGYGGDDTCNERANKHDSEGHHDLTQVRGPREEVTPLLLPSLYCTARLARYKEEYKVLARRGCRLDLDAICGA